MGDTHSRMHFTVAALQTARFDRNTTVRFEIRITLLCKRRTKKTGSSRLALVQVKSFIYRGRFPARAEPRRTALAISDEFVTDFRH